MAPRDKGLLWRAQRPIVLVACGVAGTGKSALARVLAARSGLTCLASDAIRKELAGLRPTQRAPEDVYSTEFTQRTYAVMTDRAVDEVRRKGGVIIDATFRRQEQRALLEERVRPFASVIFVECRAPAGLSRERVRERRGRGGDASDAEPHLVDLQLDEWEPVSSGVHLVLKTTRSPEELADAVERELTPGFDPSGRGAGMSHMGGVWRWGGGRAR